MCAFMNIIKDLKTHMLYFVIITISDKINKEEKHNDDNRRIFCLYQ